jgi:hypothetical protein
MMKRTILLCFIAISILSCKDEKESKNVAEAKEPEVYKKIAIANGFKEFDSISKIKFTFNVKVNDTLRSERRWVWDLNSKKISLTEKDSTMSYIKKDSIAKEIEYIDQRFVNDSYWLLFPFQLKWANAEFSEQKMAKAPISGQEMQMLTVSYPSEGGYTPGDSYDIYFDDENMIREWVYKASGGGRELATTWEDYQDFEGIKIAKMHKSKDANFQLFFTDISIER